MDRTITPESLIFTRGLSTAAILAALYNAASGMGHGEKGPGPDMITLMEAKKIIASLMGAYIYFDYLGGKRLKLDLTDAKRDGIVAGQYDYGQGRGTAMRAIAILRATGDLCHPDIVALQEVSRAAANTASAPLQKSGTVTEGTLADALGMRDRSTEKEPDIWYQLFREAPCDTIKL
ncbi:MAG: hypothetical protein A3I44_02835 [Candidatus Sungbacteria bacterium RIFCSPLOWO2_02_FULL_51_17]|uniref:Uncharacterized protein n=1 Tax=Candidatus Sungbacteria bacterium RIFCSPHIGHO2_02_FULL_51_29 TaxID=1802273 RepID=A0A1G2KRU9_9BACT|nr:MAG: hypothetical protein A2676_00490 [Candidatus Sungbacteria bacterium RIFCSPHIGHO2_01_FULL_51_22]OHA02063.1 MAG: hypothetical protein A3C16_04325 [Candidatus Sungbacteria bacterium RIFCSPHIGHO2_02_FULL_51_29]OHA10831.1 MAG: hypothetical protein A3I44_02835 [Candidatus Sungbacteria bacterium RIFCSPLOWO2_02_FULL_51_17]